MPTPLELLREIGDVAHDVPAFLAAPLFRRRHLRWGATPIEVAESLPGDELTPHAQFTATRAITIHAAPEAVWPWLVQVGCRRAGWYSHDVLDNVGRPSATTIIPELQHLEVGQWVPMSPSGHPSERTAFKVDSFRVNEWLLWTKPDSTWAWRPEIRERQRDPLGHAYSCRLRLGHPLTALLGVVLMEFGDFAMSRKMLRGIKTRAESFQLPLQPSGALSPNSANGHRRRPLPVPERTRGA